MMGRPAQIMSRSSCLLVVLVLLCSTNALAQRVAILTPGNHDRDSEYAGRLSELLPPPVRPLDNSQSVAAFRSIQIRDAFNMDVAEAKTAAAVMGCDYFVLVRTGEQRRSSFSKPDYHEAFAVLYVVSARTGELVSWFLKSYEADAPAKAWQALAASIPETANDTGNKIKASSSAARRASPAMKIEEVPNEDSPATTDLKPPIPYRRIKPDYTTTAFLYGVKATIDIEADIDSDGTVKATRIVRWAGFGLEESVEKAVRVMNWRPAMRAGKPLPMRVLLRYNFTKVDKEQ